MQNLAVDMDTEGRYLFLNCITNQLRYPNSHTHYYSCCLLYLFAEANTEAIQEQITRFGRIVISRGVILAMIITAIHGIFDTFLFYLFNLLFILLPSVRVLLERLIVNRPHPWGLLITFIELIKNPTFKFWTHEFVHCAPEIQVRRASTGNTFAGPGEIQFLCPEKFYNIALAEAVRERCSQLHGGQPAQAGDSGQVGAGHHPRHLHGIKRKPVGDDIVIDHARALSRAGHQCVGLLSESTVKPSVRAR